MLGGEIGLDLPGPRGLQVEIGPGPLVAWPLNTGTSPSSEPKGGLTLQERNPPPAAEGGLRRFAANLPYSDSCRMAPLPEAKNRMRFFCPAQI